ncbi:MAG: hypothetical protein EAZ95_11970 [Bacteroidetes bacterium]|nr:MAG: hypothetical protein EAZ95_11970 [Bacteroidota bacterium]
MIRFCSSTPLTYTKNGKKFIGKPACNSQKKILLLRISFGKMMNLQQQDDEDLLTYVKRFKVQRDVLKEQIGSKFLDSFTEWSEEYKSVDGDATEQEKLKKEVDKIYYEAWLTHRPYASPFDQVKNLNQIIFDKFNFTRNVQNPNTPSNSMINVVVESKRGNPIALCIVYMLVAQRLKMPVFGVNLPNLFVLTYKSDETQFYINAFNRGMIFSRTDIDDYIAKLNIPTNTIFYEPCNHLDIVLRVLRNLTMSFEYLGDADKVAELKDVLKMLS